MPSTEVQREPDSSSNLRKDTQGGERESFAPPFHIPSSKPGPILLLLEKIERLIPSFLRPEQGTLVSFKNRILFSTLVLTIGVLVIVGLTLQGFIFPKLEGDSTVIVNLKIFHFVASLIVIVVSWFFIEFISKRITLPLRELTRTADRISREAGAQISKESLDLSFEPQNSMHGDEIAQLTSSFNRMLFYLKASEWQLRRSEEKYRFLFDGGPSPIFVIDADDLLILDVNARAEEEYGYTRQDFLSMTFADLGLDRDREETRNRLKQVFATDVTLLPVLQHKRKDGSPFMVNFQASLSSYRNRPAIMAAVWDVTERLQRHAKLIQAGKMATLGEMATGIAHELNQPLNVVRLGCDYLLKMMRTGREFDPADIEKLTKELTYSVERASRIINHLRQFGRRSDEAMVPTDLNKPILNVFTLLGTQLENRGIRWQLSLDVNLPKIMGDDNRLEQVFINLILNSRDAILSHAAKLSSGNEERQKLITINSFLEHDRAVVTITDTGAGIPETIRPKVFEPFFTTKKRGEGTGLGLSISYGIVREHDGTIEIDPDSADGTTFRLTFPIIKDGET